MSLDITLIREINVGDFNITHNLVQMAMNVPIKHSSFTNLYELLWCWEKHGINVDNLLELLPQAISYMVLNRARLEELNPENWWWSYEWLLQVCSELLSTCQELEDREEIKIHISK